MVINMWPVPESPAPEMEDIIDAADWGVCPTSCEEQCEVEPDGVCEHGHPSWLIRWGMI
jgi:hypothetical protein